MFRRPCGPGPGTWARVEPAACIASFTPRPEPVRWQGSGGAPFRKWVASGELWSGAYFLNEAPRRTCLHSNLWRGVKETTAAARTDPAHVPPSVRAWPRNMGKGGAGGMPSLPSLRARSRCGGKDRAALRSGNGCGAAASGHRSGDAQPLTCRSSRTARRHRWSAGFPGCTRATGGRSSTRWAPGRRPGGRGGRPGRFPRRRSSSWRRCCPRRR